MKKRFLCLGIESSCDETAAAVVADGQTVLSNVIASQIETHKKYGGVVPEIASRCHVQAVNMVLERAVSEAGVDFSELDLVAVTKGPGLVGSLLVGVSAAKAAAYVHKLPLVGVNHLEGHIAANFLGKAAFPAVCLLVSGGHTELVYLPSKGEYELLGTTRDDAAGEAFDKIARALNLGYPGGPKIDRLAALGDPGAYNFPQGLSKEDTLDFSFSGLKSAVLNYLNQYKGERDEKWLQDLCAGVQRSITEILVMRTITAAQRKNAGQIFLAGGVACNSGLRRLMQAEAEKHGFHVTFPEPILCTDNAAMIAAAGTIAYQRGERADLSLNAYPGLDLHFSR